ncbi:DUF4179 domain-containing protein [Paenibacillus sp. NEAU-GSW1]|uniref:DUF4179 domain-containing protein n=1 Tax=Paenibacillus sp. NEAU-GSW1 TaxID=2682486 RepID=UPI001564E8AD|nr:DUF4179 domain-containing protein [Paenibacillus sp. NEAU-GSW1]
MSKDLETEKVVTALQNDREFTDRMLSQMQEEKLDAAIRAGMNRGRKRTARARRTMLSLRMTAALLSVVLLLTAFVRVSPAFAALLRDIPGFSGFVELIEGDKTLWSAINNEFVQPVNLSDSKNGYTLTVDGIMADDQRVVILFSGTGPGVSKNTEIKDYQFTDENNKDIEAGIASFSIPDDQDEPNTVMHDTLDIIMGEGIPVPQVIKFKANLEGQWLSVDIPVDHSRFEGMKETIAVNKSFEVSGIRFMVKELVVTPLQAKVVMQTERNDLKRANNFIKLALVDEEGRRWETKGGSGMSDDEERSIYFQSAYFEKPKQLTLVADGLLLSDRNKQFVINTTTGETLTTPDARITLTNVEQRQNSLGLTVKLARLSEHEGQYGYWFFDHGASFKDASGKVYKLLDRSGTQSSWHQTEKGTEMEIYYDIPKADYVQPLTFEVYQYPGYTMEPVQIRIK